jgi:hypothetical protein
MQEDALKAAMETEHRNRFDTKKGTVGRQNGGFAAAALAFVVVRYPELEGKLKPQDIYNKKSSWFPKG